jgi:ribokinase
MGIEFLAIGDTVTDAFITLKDARVTCDINDENCTITMRWADKIPYETLTVVPGVGNAANAAVAAARLGLKTAFVSNVGKDNYGKEILTYFKKEKLGTKWIRVHKGIPTNYHFVLSYHSERTILVKHEAYPYTFPKDVPVPKTAYLSSLAGGTEAYHEAIADWLEAHPDTFFCFQPGTFQIKMGAEKLARLYKRADIFFANKEEYQRILGTKEESEETLSNMMHELGPKTCVLTDGRNGAYALENGQFFKVELFPDPRPPKERTGAGDAYSSTTAAYLTMGMNLKDAMLRASVNAASVVQEIGAQKGLLTKSQIEDIIRASKYEAKS